MNIIEAFKHYKTFGLSCLPTKDDKSPFSPKKWIETEFTKDDFEGAFGIGIKCGKVSDNLECIDFDNHFEDAKKNITDFISQIDELYKKYNFPIESTTSGGFHLLYKCKTIESSKKLASRPKLKPEGRGLILFQLRQRAINGFVIRLRIFQP
jgi:hypothetical protein